MATPPSVADAWNSIFTDNPLEEFRPFQDSQWEVFILAHELVMDDLSYAALATSAQALGDPELVSAARCGAWWLAGSLPQLGATDSSEAPEAFGSRTIGPSPYSTCATFARLGLDHRTRFRALTTGGLMDGALKAGVLRRKAVPVEQILVDRSGVAATPGLPQ